MRSGSLAYASGRTLIATRRFSLRVLREIDLAHAAGAEQADDLVAIRGGSPASSDTRPYAMRNRVIRSMYDPVDDPASGHNLEKPAAPNDADDADVSCGMIPRHSTSCALPSSTARSAPPATRSSRTPSSKRSSRSGVHASRHSSAHMPTATEDEIGWVAVERLSIEAAALLTAAFEAHREETVGCRSRPIRGSTATRSASSSRRVRFNGLAPNMIVKIPATRAGHSRLSKRQPHLASRINATVCFTLPQCVAVADAVERGPAATRGRGHDISTMGPVCTIMVGRLDDWLKVVMDHEGISTDPGHLEWAGVAVFKKTYRLFRERGYRIRLLSAAFRNHMHWSELIGGDVVISPPSAWQKRFVASDIEVRPRIDTPVASVHRRRSSPSIRGLPAGVR